MERGSVTRSNIQTSRELAGFDDLFQEKLLRLTGACRT